MLVETEGLTKRYGRFAALQDCSLGVRRGEIFGLLGPNGAGKTTLLRILMGFLRPTGGCARIDGLDCTRQSVAVHERVAYLPGDARLFRQMRGRDVLRFFAEVRAGGDLQRSQQLAARLDLDLSRRVGYMSTGMRQKLALAATLSSQTPLLILDEPTSNLDPTIRGDVTAMIGEARNDGRTVLFSSHILSEVEEVCDRVALLRQGQLVHSQVMADLRRRHLVQGILTGQLPDVPESLRSQISVTEAEDQRVLIETPGELGPLLGWLATLPLAEVRIEPVGLRRVYDQFHRGGEPPAKRLDPTQLEAPTSSP